MGVKHFTSSSTVDTLLEPMVSPIGEKCSSFPPVLNASSPTVVNGEWENHYRHEILNNRWYRLIDRVFGCFASASNDSFVEEFHYTVISCDLLNDSHPLRLPKVSAHGLLPTKMEKKSNGIRIKTFPYMTSILLVRRILNLLKSKNGCKRKIVIGLLITLYLTFQQEAYRLLFQRQNALKILNAMLRSLQKLRLLQHNFLAAHKEISNRNDGKVSHFVKDLLNSSLDLIYYSMLSFTEKLLPISDTSELSKYCEIYDATLPELYYRLTEPAHDVESRWSRLKLMTSLMLCCLLSQNHNDNGDTFSFNSEIRNFLGKLFPHYDHDYNFRQKSSINESSRLTLITTNMQHLQNLTASITLSMLRHTELINNCHRSIPNARSLKRYSKFYLPPEHKPVPSSQKVSTTLQNLRELEKLLISTNEETAETDDSVNKLVRQRLVDLSSMWKNNHDDVETASNSKKNRISITKFGNRGLSLDVLQNPTKSTTRCGGPHLQLPPKLDNQISFTAVDDAQSDIELDSDNELQRIETTNIGYDEEIINNNKRLRSSDKTLIDNRIAKFKSLSDEELKRKLNEGISKFAQENKQGRQKLRNQKSFELLRKPNSNEFMSVHGALRQISSASEVTLNNSFSTEETIPMYYELQRILDK